MRILLMLSLFVVAVGVTQAQARPPHTALERSQAKQLKTLRSQKTTLKRQLSAATSNATAAREDDTSDKRVLGEQIAGLTAQVTALTQQRDGLVAENSSLTSANASLTLQNTGLAGTVNQQVEAIARAGDAQKLRDYVLDPLHGGWACGGSVYLGSTFISYDFDLRDSDGNCY